MTKQNTMHRLVLLQGTTRPGNRSQHVTQLIKNITENDGDFTVQLADPAKLDLPHDGNDEDVKDPAYTKMTAEADAFVAVVPEYNHSFPGSLKRMLDSELSNYIHKPIAFAGVSNSNWGGVRAIEALVPAVREMGLVATFTDVQFPSVSKLFNDSGELQDDAYIKRVQRMLTELKWMSSSLRYGRENLESSHH